jgi:hypothetical protein
MYKNTRKITGETKGMEPEKVRRLIKPLHVFTVKHPQLKRIRRALRTVIKLAVVDEYKRLTHYIHLYDDKRFNGNGLTPTQKRRRSYLQHKRTFLKESFKNSIIVAKDDNRLYNADPSGERLRFTEVIEFENEPWNEYAIKKLNGARFIIKHVFYSPKKYEQNPRYFTVNQVGTKQSALENSDLCITFKESFIMDYPSLAGDI